MPSGRIDAVRSNHAYVKGTRLCVQGEGRIEQHGRLSDALKRQPVLDVFSSARPILDAEGDLAFISRAPVVTQLIEQVRRPTGCPAIILYGLRRRGKTTVLRTLDRFLPSDVRMAMLSMQDAKAFVSMEFFIRTLAGEINAAVDAKDEPRSLPDLQRFLGTVDAKLHAEDRRLIVLRVLRRERGH